MQPSAAYGTTYASGIHFDTGFEFLVVKNLYRLIFMLVVQQKVFYGIKIQEGGKKCPVSKGLAGNEIKLIEVNGK